MQHGLWDFLTWG